MTRKILIIKTSSMGDVIHTLPALTDALNFDPDIQFDWVVEKSFQEIPAWHKGVGKVIPIAFRQWRKNPVSKQTRLEFKLFIKQLRQEKYDLIIDAQGLVKSAWITLFAKGKRCGYNYQSSRESLAAIFYQKHAIADWTQHAVKRMRQLFADLLDYTYDDAMPDYGIDKTKLADTAYQNYIVFLHGTTWASKHWPEQNWIDLAKALQAHTANILIPWGNAVEKKRAEKISLAIENGIVLPKMNLAGVASILANAKLVYAVDTGLGHLAAALHTPAISMFGPTDPVLTGAYGQNQYHLAAQFECAPCLLRECNHALFKDNIPPCYQTVSVERASLTGMKILGMTS